MSGLEPIYRDQTEPVDHQPHHRIRGQAFDLDIPLLQKALQRTQQAV
jgi:hypothetical protein